MPEPIAEAVRRALRAEADPARAAGQQSYMKSVMPFYGVPVPRTRLLTRACVPRGTDAATLRSAARTLWDTATHREERYAAMALLALAPPAAENFAEVEHMTRSGQWWDITDELAHRVADLHDALPEQTARTVRQWCTDDDLWMRRLAILSQLGRRSRVDIGVLVDTLEPNRDDPEFFIRKAIGWALREYARVDPEWVQSYVGTHELRPLSRREALRHLQSTSGTTPSATITGAATTPSST